MDPRSLQKIIYIHTACGHQHYGPPVPEKDLFPVIGFELIRHIQTPQYCVICSQTNLPISPIYHWACGHEYPEWGICPYMKVVDLADNANNPNRIMKHPRWCKACEEQRKIILFSLPKQYENYQTNKPLPEPLEIAFERGIRDGRIEAEGIEFEESIQKRIRILEALPQPYQRSDALIGNADRDPLLKKLIAALARTSLVKKFANASAMRASLQDMKVIEDGTGILGDIALKYRDGKRRGLHYQWQAEYPALHVQQDGHLRRKYLQDSLTAPIQRVYLESIELAII